MSGATLLDALAAQVLRFVVMERQCADAVALWVTFSHLVGSVSVAPILAIVSPEKRCGKTTVLALLLALVNKPLPSSNISAAALYRSIELWEPTLLIDEADTFLQDSDGIRGVINSGHTRVTAYVIRTVGDEHEPRRFKTWCPKAIALIGKLPDTLADRSIEIALKRKLPREKVEKLRHADPSVFKDLCRQCARFAIDNAEAIRGARPMIPDELHDRAADNWEPLLAIAEIAGEKWPERARAACLGLSGSGDAETETQKVQLLIDIAEVFQDRTVDKLPSGVLVEGLTAMTDRPWVEANRGRSITQTWLARRLGPFKIKPKQIWVGQKDRGYELSQFKDAFSRYIPTANGGPGRTQAGRGFRSNSQTVGDDGPTTCENARKPNAGAGSTGPTTCETPFSENEDDRGARTCPRCAGAGCNWCGDTGRLIDG